MTLFRIKWLNSNYQPCICQIEAVSIQDAKNRVEMRGIVERFISVHGESN